MKTDSLVIKTPEGIVFSQALAGPVTRFLAWFIDLLSIAVLVSALETVLGLLGFLIVFSGRPPVRLAPATLLAAAAAVVLGAGKFLFHARHTSVVHIVMQVAGGLLGALLASRLAHAKHKTAWLRAADHGTRPGTYRRTELLEPHMRPAVSGQRARLR